MTLGDELLLNYADGNLSAGASERIAQLLKADAPARERLRLIRLSGDALAGETSRLSCAPVVDQLADRILSDEFDSCRPNINCEDVAQIAADSVEQIVLNDTEQGALTEPQLRFRSAWRLPQVAAALGLLAIGLAGGYFGAAWLPSQTSEQLASHPAWLVRIVDYHTLYGRETVIPSKSSQLQVTRLEQRFARFLKQTVTIPDLQVGHLEFRRGQVLKFGSEPIIQLVYLPENEGRPVALCLKNSEGEDRDMSFTTLHGLGVVRWRQNNIDYVLVGDRAASLLRIAAEHAAAQIGGEQRI